MYKPPLANASGPVLFAVPAVIFIIIWCLIDLVLGKSIVHDLVPMVAGALGVAWVLTHFPRRKTSDPK
jgi:hypothetical protein